MFNPGAPAVVAADPSEMRNRMQLLAKQVLERAGEVPPPAWEPPVLTATPDGDALFAVPA